MHYPRKRSFRNVSSSISKCRNCKVGRHDLGSNPGPHSGVWV